MPGFVEVFVKGARCLPGFPRWDDRRLAGLGQRLEHPLVGIEGFVANEGVCFQRGQQRIGSSQVMRLTTTDTRSGRWTRIEDSWVVEQRVGWCAMSRGGEPWRGLLII